MEFDLSTNNLLQAVESRNLSLLQYLLEHGHDPNYPITNMGWRPVHFAVKYQFPEILQALLYYGASLEEESSTMMISLLQLAIHPYHTTPEISLQLLEILLATNQINNPDILGQALQYACGMGYPDVVKLLIKFKADPNYYPVDDEYAMTPLIGMIFENEPSDGHREILQILLSAGVDLSHRSGDMTAEDYAIAYGRDDLLPLLKSSRN